MCKEREIVGGFGPWALPVFLPCGGTSVAIITLMSGDERIISFFPPGGWEADIC